MPATLESPSPRAPRTRATSGRAMQKGQKTKAAIVEAALGLATHIGLEGLSIGALADITGMSKSGLVGALTTLALLVATVYFAARTMRVPYLYQSVASSPAMQLAWAQLSPENAVVAHVEQPLMIDYWDAMDPLGPLSLRDKMRWHLREWAVR